MPPRPSATYSQEALHPPFDDRSCHQTCSRRLLGKNPVQRKWDGPCCVQPRRIDQGDQLDLGDESDAGNIVGAGWGRPAESLGMIILKAEVFVDL